KRVNAVIEAGKIGKVTAEKMLLQPIEALTMSLDDLEEDGTLKKTELEERLIMAESMSDLISDDADTSKPAGGSIPSDPEKTPTMTKEEQDAFYALSGL